MIKKLFLASALGMCALYFDQTTVFEEKFEDPAKRALWTIGDRDGDADTWEFLDAGINEVDSFSGYFAASFFLVFRSFYAGQYAHKPFNQFTFFRESAVEF